MDGAQKGALAALFAAQHGGSARPDPAAAADLERAGLASGGRPTASGRAAISVVLAGGVFDIIHPGHVHTLREARALGDALVVVVATERTAVRLKRRAPLHAAEQRRDMVASLSMVDACVVGSETDIFETVRAVSPDVIALGYDQAHQERGILDGCARIGLSARVARLQSPMPAMSSTEIERRYGDAIHGL